MLSKIEIECPSIRSKLLQVTPATINGGIPCESIIVAAVCRQSWKRIIGRSADLAVLGNSYHNTVDQKVAGSSPFAHPIDAGNYPLKKTVPPISGGGLFMLK